MHQYHNKLNAADENWGQGQTIGFQLFLNTPA